MVFVRSGLTWLITVLWNKHKRNKCNNNVTNVLYFTMIQQCISSLLRKISIYLAHLVEFLRWDSVVVSLQSPLGIASALWCLAANPSAPFSQYQSSNWFYIKTAWKSLKVPNSWTYIKRFQKIDNEKTEFISTCVSNLKEYLSEVSY